ncbi:MAG TPA: ABC transporter transmembrane domain-containing protein, partial [Anaerolineae bacterium]
MMMGGPGRHGNLFQNEARKPVAASATLARFWVYFKRYWIVLIAVVALIVLSTYMQILTPNLTGQVVDCFLTPATQKLFSAGAPASIPGAPTSAPTNCWYAQLGPQATSQDYIAGLGGLILIIAGLAVASALLTGLTFYLMNYAGQNVLRNLRVAVFAHIHRLSLGYFSKHEAGDVMTRITMDADTVQQAISFPLVSLMQGVLLIVWVTFTMLTISPVYAVISLLVTPLMFFATTWFSDQARKAFRKVRSAVGDVNANLQESFAAVREAQAFNREAENISNFNESNAASRDASIRATTFTSALSPTLEALGYVSMAIVAGVGGLLLLSKQNLLGETMSLGLIIAFLGYTQRFNQPISQISVMWTNIQSAIAGAERIFGLLDTEPDLVDQPGAIQMPPIKGRVELQNVSAEYEPGECVLCDLNLVAEPGQMVAIVGPTGAGKT